MQFNNRAQIGKMLDAIEANDLDKIHTILEEGIDLNDQIDIFPLLKASDQNNTEIIRLLVENGADVNLQGDDDLDFDSSLMWAARHGNLEAVKVLVELGANVNAKSMYQETALDMAVFNQHEEVCKYLTPLTKPKGT